MVQFLEEGMSVERNNTQELLDRAKQGDARAFEALFQRHRGRLRQVIVFRMGRRLAARADASDVLQETYLEAFRRLPKYLEQQDMPFYLWLRWIAKEKVMALYRRHLGADKRAIDREIPLLPPDSSAQFVSGVIGGGPSPSQQLAKAELAERLRMALVKLEQDERDLILWRHFEQLSIRETAQLLHISEAAASKRYIRALERLRELLVSAGIQP
jgi:RNA polymerase sigma-70 factor (ECF subfamily)